MQGEGLSFCVSAVALIAVAVRLWLIFAARPSIRPFRAKSLTLTAMSRLFCSQLDLSSARLQYACRLARLTRGYPPPLVYPYRIYTF